MTRVVVDTNVVVSSVLTPSGPSFEISGLASQGLIQLCASVATVAEYREVLGRKQFAKLRVLSDRQLTEISKVCKFVTTAKKVVESPDPDDDIFLECAEAAIGVEGRSALEIFGSPDDLKLRSSATLFACVSPQGSVFERLLAKYFGGVPDEKTKARI